MWRRRPCTCTLICDGEQIRHLTDMSCRKQQARAEHATVWQLRLLCHHLNPKLNQPEF